jgi:hypothetical protein
LPRHDASVAVLRNLDDDWAGLVAHVGPCLHDPEAVSPTRRWSGPLYSLERMDILPADVFGVREGYRSLKSLL